MKMRLNLIILCTIILFGVCFICSKRYFPSEKYAIAQPVDHIVEYGTGREECCAYIKFQNGEELQICFELFEDKYKILSGDSIFKPVDKNTIFLYRKNEENKYVLFTKIDY